MRGEGFGTPGGPSSSSQTNGNINQQDRDCSLPSYTLTILKSLHLNEHLKQLYGIVLQPLDTSAEVFTRSLLSQLAGLRLPWLRWSRTVIAFLFLACHVFYRFHQFNILLISTLFCFDVQITYMQSDLRALGNCNSTLSILCFGANSCDRYELFGVCPHCP